jgi:signal transduction histidine kinase
LRQVTHYEGLEKSDPFIQREDKMLRNKAYRQMLIILSVITIWGSGLGFLLNSVTGVGIGVISLLLTLSSLWITRKRYIAIKELSGYLRRIYSGNYSLDIRDNTEGELSILKNEIYKVTQILSKQSDQLMEEKELLANAISDISHQLKTPLTSMTVLADVLSDEELDPEKRREFTKTLNTQLERMEWLLTSLLKLAKIDAGAVKFKQEPIAAADLIEKAMRPLLIPMELKEQRLVIEDKGKVSFCGDFNWSTEALINIIKNCMEHTQNGGTITIVTEDNPIYTGISISDNGKGIAKEDLPYIFKRFYKGKDAGEESIGIGLAMAKSIIEKQNGDITVSSQLFKGTKFIIKFYKQVT